MKKTLLLASLFAGGLFTMNAQTTVSFETSEGYSLGLISGQNGWIDAYTDSDTSTISVSNTRATDGTQSLQFTSNGEEWAYYDGIIGNVNGSWTGTFDMLFDIYLDSNSDSDCNVHTLQEGVNETGDPTYNYVSRLQFNWQGAIRVVNGTAWASIGNYSGGQWYSIKASYNFSANTVSFYLVDGATESLLSTVPTTGTTTGITHLFISYDNYGSGMTIDNIRFVNPNASIDSPLASSFSVYPNPTKNVLNISNSIGAEVNSVIVTDINGRTVKQINSNVSQINVSDLNAGVYFVNIKSTEGSLTKKVVKQ